MTWMGEKKNCVYWIIWENSFVEIFILKSLFSGMCNDALMHYYGVKGQRDVKG